MSFTSAWSDDDVQEVNEKNFRKIHDKAEKVGYSDGIAAGSDNVFQSSFDKGYADGLRTGFELEKFRAFSETMLKPKNATSPLSNEAKIYREIIVPETTKSDHFQFNKHNDLPLDEVSKYQQQHVNKYLEEFADKLPKTNNLLSLKN